MKDVYKVVTNGQEMGEYRAASAGEALDAYAIDAGYQSYEDLEARIPGAVDDDVEAILIETAEALAKLDAEVAAETEASQRADCYRCGALSETTVDATYFPGDPVPDRVPVCEQCATELYRAEEG